jgi:hypothetical protein
VSNLDQLFLCAWAMMCRYEDFSLFVALGASQSPNISLDRRPGMRCFWEQTGALGPIYRALGQGLNDRDIAKKLNLTEVKVQTCIAWIVHFLKLKNRQELVVYASSVV